jgi:predicted HNH restriction endonuclease
MSERINQIIEVIEEVRDKFRIQKGSIHNMRVLAVRLVATHRGIAEQTVIDKFSRQLRPDITSAAQFDKLLEEWLNQDSSDLQNILLKHKFYYDDVVLINNTFDKADEEVSLLVEDTVLADEFGFDTKDPEFIEGREKLRIHLDKERSPTLVKLAKEKWSAENYGNTKCSICSFSFFETYGEVGKGYIEAHHLLPLSELTSTISTRIDDLAPVCSNCHSMIHRHRPWISITELKEIVTKLKA